MTGATLTIIRHGETAWSLTGQHTGTTDLALTPHGEAEARALVPYLDPAAFAGILTSPRLRARQTCGLAGLADAVIEPDLAEWDYGTYEGRRSADIRVDRPDWAIYRDGCPGGESPAQVSARADRVIARLDRLGGRIALVSHGQFACSLAARWIGLDIIEAAHFSLGTASLSVLGHSPSCAAVRAITLWNFVPAWVDSDAAGVGGRPARIDFHTGNDAQPRPESGRTAPGATL